MVSPGVTAAHAGSDPTPPRRRGARARVLTFGLLAVLAALAFPFAPVQQPQVSYAWPAGPGDPTPAAIPLMPYHPVDLTATVGCAAARAAPDGLVLISTVPLAPDPAAAPLAGLAVTAGPDGGVTVRTGGADLGRVALPAGDCTVSVESTPERTLVRLDGAPVLDRAGDVRPAVAGVFTEAADTTGLRVELVTDTRFQTSATPLKWALGAACLLGLLGLLGALGRADRSAARAVRALPGNWWRPRAVDGAVAALLALWWAVGAITVDDGYIAGIVRSRASNGVIGNVYRWLNAPEAPFSWFYELYHAWSLISPSTPWMRLPSTLLGLLCWWLLSRAVLPRLGRVADRRWTPWLAAVAFATWWIPFNLGLRPEPWVAVGTLAVFAAVERALATRLLRPLALGLVVAGATAAATPAGLIAFTPVLAAAVPVLRLLRARRDLRGLPVAAALAAGPAAALLLMAADQSLAGILESTRVRARVGGGLPWYQEYERYALLLTPDYFQGAIGRRAAVLATLLAAAAVAWVLAGRPRAGIAAGPARRLVAGFLLSLVVLTFSPTKWTQHFGDLAGVGAAVLLLGLVAAGGLRVRAGRAGIAAWAGATIAAGLVLAGFNTWPYASAWFAPTWSTLIPMVAGIPLATIALVAGAAVVAGLLAASVRRRAAGRPDDGAVRGPAAPVAVLLVAVLALQVLSLARVAAEHPGGYTLASDTVATLRGEPCGLHRKLLVETDPAAGVLPALPGPVVRLPTAAVDAGGVLLPGIRAAGVGATPWYALTPEQRAGTLPVVVTVDGAPRPGDVLAVEWRVDGEPAGRGALAGTDAATARDRRLPAPAGADAVRIVVDAPRPGRDAATVSAPRAPRLTPMTDVLPPGSTAVLDWPVAFLFPCLRPAPLPAGTASLPGWRVGPPADDDAAAITYLPGFGGPFATPRLLVTERRMPTYLVGDPLRDAAQLYRWVPVTALDHPAPTVTSRTVGGLAATGHAVIPG